MTRPVRRHRRRRQPNRALTSVEQRIEAIARALVDRTGDHGIVPIMVRFGVFVAKQAWACIFGAAMLAVLLAARLGYPDHGWLSRNDAITLAAVAIQALMIIFRLETWRELRVVMIFHVVGTGMELFKTAVGSWSYPDGGVLHLAGVPLYSGFMYAAVGSYMVRVYRLFDLRFTRYPPLWLSALVAAACYLNFFSHHYIVDLRWALIIAVLIVFGPSTMYFRVFDRRLRMPLVLAFALVALFIWFAENVATWAGAWFYPDQVAGWHPVSPQKLAAWFLLMIISVVLVTWVYPPHPPERSGGDGAEPAVRGRGAGLDQGDAAGDAGVAAAGRHRDRGPAGQGDAEQLAVVVDVGLQQHAAPGLADDLGPVAVQAAQVVGPAGGDDVQVGEAGAEQVGDRLVGVVEPLGIVDQDQQRSGVDPGGGEHLGELVGTGSDPVEQRAAGQR